VDFDSFSDHSFGRGRSKGYLYTHGDSLRKKFSFDHRKFMVIKQEEGLIAVIFQTGIKGLPYSLFS